ncbi:unnamed protein product, partial [Rotaria sordida]
GTLTSPLLKKSNTLRKHKKRTTIYC